MLRILLIEDAEDVAELIAHRLRRENYAVLLAADGLEGLSVARRAQPDLVVLDRNLPGLDGLEVLRRLRHTSDVPVIMLTSRGSTADRIEGLDVGANDYLPKPFDVGELLARIRAQLRGRLPLAAHRLEVGDLWLDTGAHRAFYGGDPIALSPTEFDLLAVLMRNAGRVQRREQLIISVWGYDFEGEDNILDVYIKHLRSKLAPFGGTGMIRTVRGIGYVIEVDQGS